MTVLSGPEGILLVNQLLDEIKRVDKLKDAAFRVQAFDDVWKLNERMNGLFYALHLMKGNQEVLECYETGRRNTHGATLSRETMKKIQEVCQ
jgi:hypothetical protein